LNWRIHINNNSRYSRENIWEEFDSVFYTAAYQLVHSIFECCTRIWANDTWMSVRLNLGLE